MNARKAAEKKPPDTRANIFLVVWLTFSTVIVLLAGNLSVDRVQDVVQGESRVRVGNLGALPLSGAPARFRYDRRRGELVYAGAVDDEAKRELVAVVRDAPAETFAQKNAYLAAVEQLAFESAARSSSLVLALLLLGGVAGALGVQLRSIANFIGHACYKEDLDLNVWWPYYVIRPLTGFLLGAVLVAIVQAGLLTVEQSDPGKVMWWAALAFLAGFGEDEFTQKLRDVSKSLFGNNPRPPTGETPAEEEPETPTGTATGTPSGTPTRTATGTPSGTATGTPGQT